MINLSTDGASLIFEFDGAQHYLWDGTMNVPLNALTVVFDESDMVTFRKANDDILLSANINEFDGFDKDSLKQWLQENAYGTAVKDGMSIKVVDELPAVGSEKFIYLKEADDHSGYGMWVYTDETGWVLSSSLNASTYQGKDAIKVEKINTGDSATTIHLKIDERSNSALTQSNSGLNLTVDATIDSASTNPVENKEIYKRFDEIHITSAETASGVTYTLNVLGVDKDEKIEIFNDQFISALTVDNANQKILLDKVKIDGTVERLSGDATNIIFEDDVKNGLEVVNHLVNVKIDATSDSGLTVSSGGVKMNADAVIDSASTNAIENKEVWRNLNEIHIVSGETADGKTYKLNVLGVDKAETINVPNGSNVTAITVDDASQSIKLDIKQADGTTSTLSGDATNVIFEDDVNNGLEVDNHNLKVKIDATSDSGLTVSSAGIKFNADDVIDSASTNAIENKAVYDALEEINIASAETPDGKTYTLNVNGKAKQNVINVPNGSNVTALTVNDSNQQILLDVKQADGSTVQLSGDATNIIFEDDIQDGLKVVNHEVYIDLVDDEQILTVDANGLKDNARLSGYTDANDADHIVLSGFSEIIDDVKIDAYSGLSAINIDNKEVELKIKDGEKILKQDDEALSSVVTLSAVTSIDNGVVDHTLHLKGIEGVEIDSATTKFTEGQNITLKLTQGSENDITISGKNYTIIDAPISAVTGKDDVLYLLKEYDDETSAYTYSQFAWIDDDWEQVSALGEGVEYVAGKNIDIYEDATTHKQTISGSQVVELTQAQYDALATKDPDKLYVLIDADGVFKVVNELPTQGLDGILYLLNKTTYYEGYFYVNNAWMPMNEDLSDVTLNAGDY